MEMTLLKLHLESLLVKLKQNESIPLGLSTSTSAGATATGTLERSAALSQRRGTLNQCVLSNEVKSQYIHWFHRDYGGLHSFSPSTQHRWRIPEHFNSYILQQYNFDKKIENLTKTDALVV